MEKKGDIAGRKGRLEGGTFLERLLDAIRRAHELFLSSSDAQPVYAFLLDALVTLTESECGFLDEVDREESGRVFKRNLVVSDLCWESPSRELYLELIARNSVFPERVNLAWEPVRTHKPVIVNRELRGGLHSSLPAGHPELRNYMGLPLMFGGDLVGVAGIANRSGGYDEGMAQQLAPFLSTCASIIQATRQREQQAQQSQKIRVHGQTVSALLNVLPESCFLMDTQGTILGGNETLAGRLGTTLADVVGRKAQEVIPAEIWLSRKVRIDEAISSGRVVEWEDERAGMFFGHRVVPIRNAEGAVDRVAAFSSDISRAKAAQKALQESETRVRAKLDAILLPNGEMGELDLADILNVAPIQAIMDDVHRLTGIAAAIIDLKGKVLVATGWQDICTEFHRAHPDALLNCQESDTMLSLNVPQGTYRAYKCRNNLWDVSTPIVVAGRHMGNLFLGQFFYENEVPDVELFKEQARKFGFDEADYLEALARVPKYSAEKVEAVMSIYARMGSLISTLSFNNLQLARTLETHKRTEEELRRANAFLDSIIENIPLMVFMKEAEQLRFVRFNRAGEELLGHSRESLLGKNDYAFFPAEQAEFFIEKDRQVLRDKTLLDIPEEPIQSKDKGERYLHTLKVPVLGANGESEYLLGISEDITERKRTLAALRESEARHKALAEENAELLAQSRRDAESTSILLHEVNHRVKNNMMAVIGLLYAQRRFIAEDLRADFQAAMTDLAGRVETLAMVHGMLSASKWGPLPLSRLFGEICQAASKLVPYGKSMTFSFVGQDVRFPAQSINSLALLLFELATNSTKHGLLTQDAIHVELSSRCDDQGFWMRYGDSGPGFPDSVIQGTRANLGIYLVRTMARHDLRGEVEFLNDNGAVVQLHLNPGFGFECLDLPREGA